MRSTRDHLQNRIRNRATSERSTLLSQRGPSLLFSCPRFRVHGTNRSGSCGRQTLPWDYFPLARDSGEIHRREASVFGCEVHFLLPGEIVKQQLCFQSVSTGTTAVSRIPLWLPSGWECPIGIFPEGKEILVSRACTGCVVRACAGPPQAEMG
jgi:hypothetical protein